MHSRFSTNTFPSWELAHPYRMLAHNGEINTLRGNRNWMRARERDLASQLFGDDVDKIRPLLRDDISDSASLDSLFELLVLSGRSPAHAISMLMPEAHGRPEQPQEVRDFFAYHSALVEPWDGPAAVAFSDGRVVGATLDRNGLRPGRWLVTRDGWVVLASESGVFRTKDENVAAKGRLRPGKLFLVDLEADRIIPDEEIKLDLAVLAAASRCWAVLRDPIQPQVTSRRSRWFLAETLAGSTSEGTTTTCEEYSPSHSARNSFPAMTASALRARNSTFLRARFKKGESISACLTGCGEPNGVVDVEHEASAIGHTPLPCERRGHVDVPLNNTVSAAS